MEKRRFAIAGLDDSERKANRGGQPHALNRRPIGQGIQQRRQAQDPRARIIVEVFLSAPLAEGPCSDDRSPPVCSESASEHFGSTRSIAVDESRDRSAPPVDARRLGRPVGLDGPVASFHGEKRSSRDK
jgi:hypothetical protein